MPDAVQLPTGHADFKDLVIDAVDAGAAADFWAATLGLTAEHQDPGPDAVLTDGIAEHTVWINQVPEPRTVKQRVHLDVHVSDLTQVLGLGATVDTAHEGWTTMRDPEGGEFCVFARDPAQLPRYRLYELAVDAADAEAVCRWWGERFGLPAQRDDSEPWWVLEGGSLPWPMVFDTVPEPKTVKNRIHWDVLGRPEDFLAAGATMLRERDDEIGWHVLADPEGNEFCVFDRT